MYEVVVTAGILSRTDRTGKGPVSGGLSDLMVTVRHAGRATAPRLAGLLLQWTTSTCIIIITSLTL